MAAFVRVVYWMTISDFIRDSGYAVLPDFSPDRVRELTAAVESLYDAEGSRAGSEFRQEPHTRRLANMVDKRTASSVDF